MTRLAWNRSEVDVEQAIGDALDALGIDSDRVAETLAGHEAVAGSDDDEDPVCLYLQSSLDPEQARVQIVECDIGWLTYALLNPDGETWSSALTAMPAAVTVFCCRLDAGEFPHLAPARP
ncbi:MAG: hypothetical protein ABWY93_22665 [Mycobacterium sp.]